MLSVQAKYQVGVQHIIVKQRPLKVGRLPVFEEGNKCLNGRVFDLSKQVEMK